MSSSTAIIALGSNLNQPAEQIIQAAKQIAMLPEINFFQLSSLYQTKPVGYLEQPDFINAVAKIKTTYTPSELLHQLQAIEQQFGRERHFKNAPRTLDLDIIDFNHQQLNTQELQLPHPRAHERGFVMIPLAEIEPDYTLISYGQAKTLASKLSNTDIYKLNNPKP